MSEPAGRVVVVTGATGALGKVVCALLSSRGATVVAVGTDAARLEGVTAAQREVCDVTDVAAVATLRARLDRVDGVLHLVGGWRGGSDPADYDWLEPRLLTSLRAVTLAFDDALAESGGRLAIISSTSVDKPTWGNANYVALKAASESWVRALAAKWSRAAPAAAAVIFAIRSIGGGENETSEAVIAERLTGLWDSAATEINGSRIILTP